MPSGVKKQLLISSLLGICRESILSTGSLISAVYFVQAEIKRRAEADRQMQTYFEGEVKGLQDKLSSQYAELSGAFKSSLEGLARTVQDLHAIIK